MRPSRRLFASLALLVALAASPLAAAALPSSSGHDVPVLSPELSPFYPIVLVNPEEGKLVTGLIEWRELERLKLSGTGRLFSSQAWAVLPANGELVPEGPLGAILLSVEGCGDGSNWYVYCGNDPVNRVDPTGLWGGMPNDIAYDYFANTIRAKEDGPHNYLEWGRDVAESTAALENLRRDVVVAPTDNRIVSHVFGEAIPGVTEFHGGIDIPSKKAGVSGEPLYAVQYGTITSITTNEKGLTFLKLKNLNGDEWVYNHGVFDESLLGKTVKAGDQLGTMSDKGSPAL
jgi:hypothetical protein